MSMPSTLTPYQLFGNSVQFVPPPWQTKDDRIRGGASQSYLSPTHEANSARFYGHLDTSTLGGAGFASQFSPVDAPYLCEKAAETIQDLTKENDEKGHDSFWPLSNHDGIELVVDKKSDAKEYTLILKDESERGKFDDGREKAGISWEVKFTSSHDSNEERTHEQARESFFFPWEKFKATYRGKEINDAEPLKTGHIRRVGIMMRSYFGKQEGDFSLIIHSISAVRT